MSAKMSEKKCMKFTRHTLCIGDRVRIVQSDQRFTGTVSGFDTASLDGLVIPVPVFRLDDGRALSGMECWWLPVEEALQAEAFVEKMKEEEKVGNEDGK